MHKVQVRFGDTGHNHDFERVDSVETLSQLIFKQLKIQINDQKLISKSGYAVSVKDSLDTENVMKQTFVGDPSNKKESMTKCNVIYLFNLRNLLKGSSEPLEGKEIQKQGAHVLSKRHETCLGLRENIYELKSVYESFSQEKLAKLFKFNVQVPEMIEEIQKSIWKFVDIYWNFRENKYCVDEYCLLVENQRKGTNVLIKNIKLSITSVNNLYKKYKNHFKDLKSMSRENIQNNLYEEDHRLQITSLSDRINRDIICLGDEIEALTKTPQYKAFFVRNKQIHQDNEHLLKDIDKGVSNAMKEIECYMREVKKMFSMLKQSVTDLVDGGDMEGINVQLLERPIIQNNLTNYIGRSESMIEQTEKGFIRTYGIYRGEESRFKKEFEDYYKMSTTLQNMEQKCKQIEDCLYELGKKIANMKPSANKKQEQNWVIADAPPSLKPKQSSHSSNHSLNYDANSVYSSHNLNNISSITNKQVQVSPKNSQASQVEREEKELTRRRHFNKKLHALNEELKAIMRQQYDCRKKFMGQENALNEFYHHPVLENINVPCFLLNFDESTDRQLFMGISQKNKGGLVGSNSSIKIEEEEEILSFYHPKSGMDRMLQELDLIKNCQISMKKDPGLQNKIKNLNTIIEKSADIFHHIYTEKTSQITKKFDHKERHLEFRIANLERQNSELKANLTTLAKRHGCDESEKTWLEQKVNSQVEEIDGLRNELLRAERSNREEKEKLEIEKRQLLKSVEEYKKKNIQLKEDQKELQKKMIEQLGEVEPLVQELEETSLRIKELQDLNTEYKILMGDQQVRIIALEAELGKVCNLNSGNLQQSFYGEHLKLAKDKGINQSEEQEEEREKGEPDQGTERDGEKMQENQKVKKFHDSVYGALQRENNSLKEEIEELRTELDAVNEQLMKIAMKDTEDQSVQAQEESGDEEREEREEPRRGIMSEPVTQTAYINNTQNYSVTQYLNSVTVMQSPKQGQYRIFIPYSAGTYIATVCHQSPPEQHSFTCYETSRKAPEFPPYILDLNCLPVKSRQLLKQCSLIVIVRVTRIMPSEEKVYVEGEMESAMGFEDDDMRVKDYGSILKNLV